MTPVIHIGNHVEKSFTEPVTTLPTALTSASKRAHTYVKVKHGGKVLKLRPATVTVTNLAMIFKLEAQQGIYIHSEEEAETILPSENGTFQVEDFSKLTL